MTRRHQNSYLEGTQDNMQFLAMTLAFNYAQTDLNKLKEANYQLIEQFLTGHLAKPDLDTTDSITGLHYDQSIAQARIELAVFVKKVLAGELHLVKTEPTEETILATSIPSKQGEEKSDDATKINADLRQAIKVIREAVIHNRHEHRFKNLNYPLIRQVVSTIQQTFGLHQSFRPELDDDKLRAINAQKLKVFERVFSNDCKKLREWLASAEESNAPADQAIFNEAGDALAEAMLSMQNKFESFCETAKARQEQLVDGQTPLKNKKPDDTVTSTGSAENETGEEKSECTGNANGSEFLKTPPRKRKNSSKGQHILSPEDHAALANQRLDVNSQDNLGNTLLTHALRHHNERFFKMFLTNGARLDIPNKSGETPLDVPDALDWLLKFRDDKNNNVFHLSVMHGNVGSFRLLYEGVKEDEQWLTLLTEKNSEGKTPFEVVDKEGNRIFQQMVLLPEDDKEDERYLEFISDIVDRVEEGNKPGIKIVIEAVSASPVLQPDLPEEKSQVNNTAVRRQLSFGTPSSKTAIHDLKIDLNHLIARNNKHDNACTLVARQVKREHEELDRAEVRFATVTRAFFQVLFYLYVQLDDLYDDPQKDDYQSSMKKLHAVQEGMRRICEGEKSDAVLTDLLQNPAIQDKRNWWDCRTSTTAKLLYSEELRSGLSTLDKSRFNHVEPKTGNYLVNTLGKAMREGRVDDVSGFCEDIDPEASNHSYRPLFLRYSAEKTNSNESFCGLSDGSTAGVLDPKRKRTPIELAAWEAVTCHRERNKLFERQRLVTHAFGLIVGHLVVSMSKYKEKSSDYIILKKKLEKVEQAMKGVITGHYVAVRNALEALRGDLLIRDKRRPWDFFHTPRTLVLIDRAKMEIEKESVNSARAA